MKELLESNNINYISKYSNSAFGEEEVIQDFNSTFVTKGSENPNAPCDNW